MNEDLKKKKKRNKVLKRIFQLTLLLFLFAALAMAIYMAVASTRLMQKRAEQQEAASIAAASRSAEAARTTQAPQPDESTAEITTEAETTTEEETSGFSFVDLFDSNLFSEDETTAEPTVSSTDYAALTELYANEKRIWMGDSRFVGLSNTVKTSSTDVFISKGAMAFDWFRDEGVPKLMQELNKDPERIVIINFGLNDCANNCAGWREYFAEDYVELINQLTVTYPNTRFCFASVGMTDGDYTAKSGEKMPPARIGAFVDDFNMKMYVGCVADYIDLSEYLIRDGYSTVDGVHFDDKTNQKIYNYCVAKAGKYKK